MKLINFLLIFSVYAQQTNATGFQVLSFSSVGGNDTGATLNLSNLNTGFRDFTFCVHLKICLVQRFAIVSMGNVSELELMVSEDLET